MSKYYDIHLLAFVHPDILKSQEEVEESRRELSRFCNSIEYFELWPKKSAFHRNVALLMGTFIRYPFSVLAHRSKAFQRRSKQIVESGEIDVIHFDTIGLAQFYSKEWQCPAVLTHHNIESQLISRRAGVEKNKFKKFYLQAQTRRLQRYESQKSPDFSINIMMSEIDATILKEEASAAVTAIIPNGVDTEYFTPRRGEEKTALIYTGGMNMYANKDAILYFIDQIWPLVKAKSPQCIFYAVGQDPPEEMHRIAEKDPSVRVTGYVDDVRPYIARSMVYVVPLRVGGGTRLKVLDAMAQGKAIVSTSIGCEGIDVSPGDNIVIADSPALFAEEVLYLLKNIDRCHEIGNAARAMVTTRYSWEIIGKQINQLYNTLILNY